MQTVKFTALYARFSYDDGVDATGGSIEHQKSLLQNYADINGFTNCRFYADDGYTGTNFNRPDFQRMLEDIRSGLIGTVIFKDMSRLGRNYLMVGQYTEIEFPKYNVRYIAISDNVDSAKGTNDLLPINNLMNEWYSRDISKKIRAQIHHKGRSGQAVTTKLPYGYKRSPDDINEWIIDETASSIVKEIFDMYLNQSLGMKVISRILNERKIVSPDSHRILLKGLEVDENKLYCWSGATIRRILRRREYVGDTVNFRTEITSYKNKKIIHNGDDKILIFENTHPAIISREMFQQAQEKYYKNLRHAEKPRKYLFNDYLYCMDCHRKMHGKKSYGSKVIKYAYECSTYRKSKGCYYHGVPEEYLMKVVLEKIQSVVNYAKEKPDEFYKNVRQVIENIGDKSKTVMSEELEKAQKRIAEIDKYIQGLFEAKVKGEIDGSLFACLKKNYDDEKNQLNTVIADLIKKLNSKNDVSEKVQILYAAIKKYDVVKELTPEVLNDFLEKIEVGKFKNNNKKIPFFGREYEISIFFWGVGIINFIEN